MTKSEPTSNIPSIINIMISLIRDNYEDDISELPPFLFGPLLLIETHKENGCFALISTQSRGLV